MTPPTITVRMTLQNVATTKAGFSLEPYGDYCDLPPDTTVHATWELAPDGAVELEIAITNDAVIVCDASTPTCELRPNRGDRGGDLWA